MVVGVILRTRGAPIGVKRGERLSPCWSLGSDDISTNHDHFSADVATCKCNIRISILLCTFHN